MTAGPISIMNFSVLVPVLARDVLRLSGSGFSMLMAAHGAGALAGALAVVLAGTRRPQGLALIVAAAVLGASELVVAGAHRYLVVATTLALAGAALVILQAAANTMLQISSPDHLRGRVMAVYSLVLAGAPPLGALLAAGLAQTWGARGAFLTCGVVGLLAVWAAAWLRATPPVRCQQPGSRYAGGA